MMIEQELIKKVAKELKSLIEEEGEFRINPKDFDIVGVGGDEFVRIIITFIALGFVIGMLVLGIVLR